MTTHAASAGLCLAAVAVLTLSGCGMMAHGQNSEGVTLYQQGYYQKALESFQQAVASDPNNADAYYNIAATYHQLSKVDSQHGYAEQAESYYNLALDHAPDHVDCHRGLAVLLVEQGSSDKAYRLLERWSERSPSLSEPHVELARLYEEFGDSENARQQLLAAIEIEPTSPRALTALGQLNEKEGNYAQALANYQRSLWHDSMQPDVQARVAALQSARPAGAPTAGTAPTRTVNTPPPVTR
ncbi:MAG: tetratricopeptide repeat protein [Pirellulales bacterium]|nr:tetratricopeptide repeat protein [Planctomycetales bacterium]